MRPDDQIRPEPRKLYVVVREDLPPGLRAAQAGHAIANACLQYPVWAREWQESDNYLIVLGVPDEEALRIAWWDAKAWGILREAFHEPDLGFQMTSFAALPHPSLNHVFSGLPLAYGKRSWWDRLRGRL